MPSPLEAGLADRALGMRFLRATFLSVLMLAGALPAFAETFDVFDARLSAAFPGKAEQLREDALTLDMCGIEMAQLVLRRSKADA